MYFVYPIRALNFPEKFYIGYTRDVQARLKTHNAGGSIFTSKYKPWELVMFLGFSEAEKAYAFERYLKSQSGRAFAKKRFW